MTLEGYPEIGATLRRAREEHQLTLAEASEHTHIRKHYLDALEQGRLQDLPDLPYVRGFLQTYAAFLNLDKDEILRRFVQIEGQIAQKELSLPEVFSKEKTPQPAIIWGSMAAALVFFLLWRAIFSSDQVAVDVGEKPHKAESSSYTGAMPTDDTCVQPQSVLYPPCYTAREANVADGLYPPRRQVNSVMELAH